MSNTVKSGAALQGKETAPKQNLSANLKVAGATVAPGQTEEEKPKPGTEPKTETKEEVKQEPKTEIPKPLTIQEKIDKLTNLNILAEKREKLIETKRNLNTFKLSADGFTNSLDLRDGNGNSFKTSNSEVIKEVINLLSSTVDCKLLEVEREIEF
jgi:hypothetical protein